MNEDFEKRLKTYDQAVTDLLIEKEEKLVEFLKRYMTPKERNRIGEDIIRILASPGDLAKIKIDIMIKEK